MINNSRELAGVGEKHNQVDFALWKRAMPEHIMRWPSPWSNGFPGWHCECTAMGHKYLERHLQYSWWRYGLDFPHHECEIAQAVASQGDEMVKYWMHNNMITINGQKMGKSLGNFITLEQFFTGKHDTLTQAYKANDNSFSSSYLLTIVGLSTSLTKAFTTASCREGI